MAIWKFSPGMMLLPIVLLDGEKAFCVKSAARAAKGFVPLWIRAVGFCPGGTEGTVVACEATGSGDRDGFMFAAASQALVFDDLLEGDPES